MSTAHRKRPDSVSESSLLVSSADKFPRDICLSCRLLPPSSPLSLSLHISPGEQHAQGLWVFRFPASFLPRPPPSSLPTPFYFGHPSRDSELKRPAKCFHVDPQEKVKGLHSVPQFLFGKNELTPAMPMENQLIPGPGPCAKGTDGRSGGGTIQQIARSRVCGQ